MLTEADKLKRRTYMGASDIARDITGKFGGSNQVRTEKVLGVENQGNPQTAGGNYAEPAMAAWYAAEKGLPRELCIAQVRVFCKSHPQIGATIDIITPVGQAECKLVFPWSRHEWEDADGAVKVNDYTLVQVHHQMLCSDWQSADVVVWFMPELPAGVFERFIEVVQRTPDSFGWASEVIAAFVGEDKHLLTVERNENLCDAVKARALDLWDEVQRGITVVEGDDVLPEPSSEAVRRALSQIPVKSGEIVQLGPRSGQAYDLYCKLQAASTALEHPKEALKTLLLAQFGQSEYAQFPDGTMVKRRLTNFPAKLVEAYTATYLDRVKKPEARQLTEGENQ